MTPSRVRQDDTDFRSFRKPHFSFVICFLSSFSSTAHNTQRGSTMQPVGKDQLKICFSPALKNNDAISGLLLGMLYGSQQFKDFPGIWARVRVGPSSEL